MAVQCSLLKKDVAKLERDNWRTATGQTHKACSPQGEDEVSGFI